MQLLIIKKELFTNSGKNVNQTTCNKKVAKKIYKELAYGYPISPKILQICGIEYSFRMGVFIVLEVQYCVMRYQHSYKDDISSFFEL